MKRLIFIILILSSCQKEDPTTTSDYIIFGHFYGECLGEGCIEIYKLTYNSLYEDSNDTYPGTSKAYEGNFHLLDNSLFEKVKGLRTSVPDDLLKTTSTIIGQPDAGDWGGIYFETFVNGKKRFWLIDKMESNLPDYLKPFVTEIEDNINLINN